jgi:hypothetical protein
LVQAEADIYVVDISVLLHNPCKCKN